MDRVATEDTLDAASTEQLTDAARKLYPKKHGTELHHRIPKYLGGPADGETVPLDAAYHQLITNEFRHLWNYGQAKPDASAVADIAKKVYTKYPIP